MKKLFASLLIGLGMGVFAASAGPNTALPFNDNFDTLFYYTNGTPLIGGTNGWYGSSSNIIVVSNNVITPDGSTNLAMIPVDCTLSNRFTGLPSSNVYLQMDLCPSLYDSTNSPVVDTNVAAMFYVNSNGNFVVYNGVVTNWVTAGNYSVGTNGTNWVTIGIYENFSNRTWNLYA